MNVLLKHECALDGQKVERRSWQLLSPSLFPSVEQAELRAGSGHIVLMLVPAASVLFLILHRLLLYLL